jgi:hypothetical protein
MFEAFFVYLYKKLWLLVVNFVIACVAGGLYSFTMLQPEYSAKVTFLPPTSDNSMSALSFMNISVPSLSLGGASPEQVEVVFNSNATKRRIVDEFDFVKYFKLENSKNRFELAAKALKKYVILSVGEKGSFGITKAVSYSITGYHSSPDTAKLIVDFAFALVDSAIREISIDKAQRSRIFVERQIAVQNKKMDSLQIIFLEFQNTNKAYDIPEQAKLSLKMYADIKAAAIMNELRLSSLKNEFSGSTHEMLELKRSQRVYDAKLREYETGDDPNIMPSLDKTSRLFPEYTKMLRDIEVQNQIILFLTKEHEQARLQEARDVSPLIIVDPTFVPEYKARPKRLFILLVVVLAENMLFMGVLMYFFAYKVTVKSDRFKSLLNTIKQD